MEVSSSGTAATGGIPWTPPNTPPHKRTAVELSKNDSLGHGEVPVSSSSLSVQQSPKFRKNVLENGISPNPVLQAVNSSAKLAENSYSATSLPLVSNASLALSQSGGVKTSCGDKPLQPASLLPLSHQVKTVQQVDEQAKQKLSQSVMLQTQTYQVQMLGSSSPGKQQLIHRTGIIQSQSKLPAQSFLLQPKPATAQPVLTSAGPGNKSAGNLRLWLSGTHAVKSDGSPAQTGSSAVILQPGFDVTKLYPELSKLGFIRTSNASLVAGSKVSTNLVPVSVSETLTPDLASSSICGTVGRSRTGMATTVRSQAPAVTSTAVKTSAHVAPKPSNASSRRTLATPVEGLDMNTEKVLQRTEQIRIVGTDNNNISNVVRISDIPVKMASGTDTVKLGQNDVIRLSNNDMFRVSNSSEIVKLDSSDSAKFSSNDVIKIGGSIATRLKVVSNRSGDLVLAPTTDASRLINVAGTTMICSQPFNLNSTNICTPATRYSGDHTNSKLSSLVVSTAHSAGLTLLTSGSSATTAAPTYVSSQGVVSGVKTKLCSVLNTSKPGALAQKCVAQSAVVKPVTCAVPLRQLKLSQSAGSGECSDSVTGAALVNGEVLLSDQSDVNKTVTVQGGNITTAIPVKHLRLSQQQVASLLQVSGKILSSNFTLPCNQAVSKSPQDVTLQLQEQSTLLTSPIRAEFIGNENKSAMLLKVVDDCTLSASCRTGKRKAGSLLTTDSPRPVKLARTVHSDSLPANVFDERKPVNGFTIKSDAVNSQVKACSLGANSFKSSTETILGASHVVLHPASHVTPIKSKFDALETNKLGKSELKLTDCSLNDFALPVLTNAKVSSILKDITTSDQTHNSCILQGIKVVSADQGKGMQSILKEGRLGAERALLLNPVVSRRVSFSPEAVERFSASISSGKVSRSNSSMTAKNRCNLPVDPSGLSSPDDLNAKKVSESKKLAVASSSNVRPNLSKPRSSSSSAGAQASSILTARTVVAPAAVHSRRTVLLENKPRPTEVTVYPRLVGLPGLVRESTRSRWPPSVLRLHNKLLFRHNAALDLLPGGLHDFDWEGDAKLTKSHPSSIRRVVNTMENDMSKSTGEEDHSDVQCSYSSGYDLTSLCTPVSTFIEHRLKRPPRGTSASLSRAADVASHEKQTMAFLRSCIKVQRSGMKRSVSDTLLLVQAAREAPSLTAAALMHVKGFHAFRERRLQRSGRAETEDGDSLGTSTCCKKYTREQSCLLESRFCAYEIPLSGNATAALSISSGSGPSGSTAVCGIPALPGTRHCLRHITYNVDQQLFSQCCGRTESGTLCRIPVFALSDPPMCPLHKTTDLSRQTSIESLSPPPVARKPRRRGKTTTLSRFGKRKRRRSCTPHGGVSGAVGKGGGGKGGGKVVSGKVVPSTAVRPPINNGLLMPRQHSAYSSSGSYDFLPSSPPNTPAFTPACSECGGAPCGGGCCCEGDASLQDSLDDSLEFPGNVVAAASRLLDPHHFNDLLEHEDLFSTSNTDLKEEDDVLHGDHAGAVCDLSGEELLPVADSSLYGWDGTPVTSAHNTEEPAAVVDSSLSGVLVCSSSLDQTNPIDSMISSSLSQQELNVINQYLSESLLMTSSSDCAPDCTGSFMSDVPGNSDLYSMTLGTTQSDSMILPAGDALSLVSSTTTELGSSASSFCDAKTLPSNAVAKLTASSSNNNAKSSQLSFPAAAAQTNVFGCSNLGSTSIADGVAPYSAALCKTDSSTGTVFALSTPEINGMSVTPMVLSKLPGREVEERKTTSVVGTAANTYPPVVHGSPAMADTAASVIVASCATSVVTGSRSQSTSIMETALTESSSTFNQLPSPSMPPTPSDDDTTTMVDFPPGGDFHHHLSGQTYGSDTTTLSDRGTCAHVNTPVFTDLSEEILLSSKDHLMAAGDLRRSPADRLCRTSGRLLIDATNKALPQLH